MLVFALATTLTFAVMYTMSLSPNTSILNNTLTILTNCNTGFSMMTNLLATLLIAYKLWLVIL